MAKQTAGDSNKTPLVVALVFFVLLSLVLGYLTYDFSDKKAQAETKAATAEKEKSTAVDERAKARDAMLVYKIALLGNENPQDATDLAGSRFKADAQKAQQELTTALQNKVNKSVAKLSSDFVGKDRKLTLTPAQLFSWPIPTADQPVAPPTVGLVDMAVNAYSNRQLLASEYDVQLKAMDENINTMKQLSNKLDLAQKAIDAKTQAIPTEIGNQVAEFQKQFDKFKDDFKKQSADYRKDLDDKTKQIDVASNLQQRAEQKADRVTTANAQLLGQLDAKLDPFQFDKPQGRVVRRTGNIVEIDIGSADNLRQGLTFSVMPADTPQRGFEARMRQVKEYGQISTRIVPKGSIEVVDILGPNIAQCRVTGEESEVRDRVLAGDLIYNAVWRKGQSEHIALYGIFDIDGDGRDDIKTVVAELDKMGVKVDAWYDLNTSKWIGEITTLTTLAVEGFSPSVGIAEGNREGKGRIISAITDARKLAKDKGIRVLRPRDFFPRIGYKAKLDLSEDTINQAATFYIRSITSDGSDLPPKKEGN